MNPAYQAMELEYALKKVGPSPWGGAWPVPKGWSGGVIREGLPRWGTPRVYLSLEGGRRGWLVRREAGVCVEGGTCVCQGGGGWVRQCVCEREIE